MEFMALKDYIKEYHGTQKAFAAFIGRSPQHVNQMLRQVYPACVLIDDVGIKFVTVNIELTHEEALERKIRAISSSISVQSQVLYRGNRVVKMPTVDDLKA